MLPCQVSLILPQKPQEAGCREIISTVGTGGWQLTLCAHRGGMALSLIWGLGDKCIQWINGKWLLFPAVFLLLCFVADSYCNVHMIIHLDINFLKTRMIIL